MALYYISRSMCPEQTYLPQIYTFSKLPKAFSKFNSYFSSVSGLQSEYSHLDMPIFSFICSQNVLNYSLEIIIISFSNHSGIQNNRNFTQPYFIDGCTHFSASNFIPLLKLLTVKTDAKQAIQTPKSTINEKCSIFVES